MTEQNNTPAKVEEHEPSKAETITVAAVMVGAVGAFGAMVWAAVKQEQRDQEAARQREEERKRKREEKVQWFNDENAAGNIVYELKDGSYLVVPRVGEQKIVVK